jgi:hypothetical protein
MFSPVNDVYKKRPNLDFEVAFFMVTVKKGSSSKIHMDFTDDPHHPSWTIPLTWIYVGGKFHTPQLGMKIPIGAGQLIAALTRIMPYAGTAIKSGERLTVTLFSPSRLIEWGTKNKMEWEAEEMEIWYWVDGQAAKMDEELKGGKYDKI